VAHLQKRGEGVVTERLWKACSKRLARPRVVAQPKIATNDMFEESDRLGLDELVDHVAEDGTDGEEALVGVTDVGEPGFVKEDLLHNEDRDRLGKFRARFHDAEAEGDDLGRKEEVYDRVVVILLRAIETEGSGWDRKKEEERRGAHFDESTDDTEGGEAKVFERTGFGRGVQERVQEEGYMCYVV
jgi:hypothetical protein